MASNFLISQLVSLMNGGGGRGGTTAPPTYIYNEREGPGFFTPFVIRRGFLCQGGHCKQFQVTHFLHTEFVSPVHNMVYTLTIA